MFPLYYYKATCLRVVDGDTAMLRIDRGFREFWEINCRLAFINAPELSSTGAPGQRAKDWLTATLANVPLWIRSEKLDKYGRPVVTIWTASSPAPLFATSVNAQMISQSLAAVYGTPP